MADAAAEPDPQQPVQSLLAKAQDSAEDGRVTISSLLDAFGNRSFGPLIALFALVAIIPPVGAIPGVPTSMGLMVLLLSVQMLFGMTHPWVPKRLERVGFGADKVARAREKARGVTKRIDALISARLDWAAGAVAQRTAAACCAALALMMPPLELLPFAAALPASGIVLFGLGMTARDGVLMLIGFALTIGSVVLLVVNLSGLTG